MIRLSKNTARDKPEDIAELVSFLAKPGPNLLNGEPQLFVGIGPDLTFDLAVGKTITADGGKKPKISSISAETLQV